MEELEWNENLEEEYNKGHLFEGEPLLTFEEYSEFTNNHDMAYGKLYEYKALKNDSIKLY